MISGRKYIWCGLLLASLATAAAPPLAMGHPGPRWTGPRERWFGPQGESAPSGRGESWSGAGNRPQREVHRFRPAGSGPHRVRREDRVGRSAPVAITPGAWVRSGLAGLRSTPLPLPSPVVPSPLPVTPPVAPSPETTTLIPPLRLALPGSASASASLPAGRAIVASSATTDSELLGPVRGAGSIRPRGIAAGPAGSRGPGHTTARHPRTPVPGGSTQPPGPSPSNVIDHFIHVVPLAVWIALGGALMAAALASAAAVGSGRRARRRLAQVEAVRAAAVTDPLTGILNRRGFNQAVERELERARRYGHPLALAFVDVRGLKAVNDHHGHMAGDRLLREAARLLHDSARASDTVARIGGDELAVLLPEQGAEGAAALSARVAAQIPAHRAGLGLGTAWDLTIGTAVFPHDADTCEGLLATADRRLYEQRGIYIR